MFIAAFFINAQTCKQPRCLPVGEWINKHPDSGMLVSTKNKKEL